MEPKIRRYKDLGTLQTLLLKACPPDAKGKKSIPLLAQALHVSHQYVYRWIDQGSVPPKYVRAIVGLVDEKAPEEDRVSLEDFHQYVF